MANSLSIGVAERTTCSEELGSAADSPTDSELLDRFFGDRDESAFGTLVRRYGPSVHRVCRRKLGDGQDADDAFQATFVVLVVRREHARQIDDLGAWLRGVARRVAARSNMRGQRRSLKETTAVDVRELSGPVGPDVDDMPPVLRSEVDRLPEKFRRPIELCYWEGLTSEEAAARLGCPTGTLKWRLARARETLRGRLSRLGIALAAVFLLRLSAANAGMSGLRSRSGGTGPGRLGGGDGGEDPVPLDLFGETLELAVYLRDVPLSVLRADHAAHRPRTSRRRWENGIYLALIAVALISSMVTSVPALMSSMTVAGPGRATPPGAKSASLSTTFDPFEAGEADAVAAAVKPCH